MSKARLFLCSGVKLGADDTRLTNRQVVPLDALGDDPSVHLNISDVTRAFGDQLSPRLTDLLELAAYVFSADSSTRRGMGWSDDASVEKYERDFHVVMPVRELKFWQQDAVQDQLRSILTFLTDDHWKVDFVPLTAKREVQGYFNTFRSDWPFDDVDRVIMFSGGLDSLAGAIESGSAGQKLVLVSHRSKGMVNERQRNLVAELEVMYPGRVLHVPVWINKDKTLGREYTQRSRSFLFASLGVIVAEFVKAKGVRFYENGVVSINLPVAEEVKRSRASRTTHPWGLSMFEKLFRLVLERDILIDNPFIDRTKEEVIASITARGAGPLIAGTCSCAHTGHFQAKAQQHCGTCSQCIDRRVAMLAANAGAFDPETDYVSDVFTGPRKAGYEQNMGVDFVHHALSLRQMNDNEIATKFNMELARAARPTADRPAAIKSYVNLHKRHAESVFRVLEHQIQKAAPMQLTGELEPTSLLAKVALSEHLKAPWRRYAERLGDILNAGLPVACKDNKPLNEPALQVVCHSLLVAAGEDLLREFPFVQWATTMAKPDWSDEDKRVWVELKYVRKKSNLVGITEALAADVTKYGDNGRRTLYVIYDPNHLIVDEQKFAGPIVSRSDMMMRIIR